MDGNQTSFAVIVRLSEVHGIFLNDRDDDRFIESLEANKEQLQEATSRTSSFLTVNREEYGKKLVSIKNVDKQLEQLEKQKQQLIREKRSLKEEADLYHITFVVSWERQAAKDTAGIEKLEADISAVRLLMTSKPLAAGGTLLQIRTIFAVSRRSEVYHLIRVTGKGMITYARALIKFLWRIGLAECPEWLAFQEVPPIGYTVTAFQSRWPFPHVQTLNHQWDIDECAARFCDMVGLPLESPPPSPENIDFVARDDDEGDEDEGSAKKRRRLSRETTTTTTDMSSNRGPVFFFSNGIRKHSSMAEMEGFWEEQNGLCADSSYRSTTDYFRYVLVPQLLEQQRIYNVERLESGHFVTTPVEDFKVAMQKARDKLGKQKADDGVQSGSKPTADGFTNHGRG